MDHSDPKQVEKDDQEMFQVDNNNDQGGSDHEENQNKPQDDENEV